MITISNNAPFCGGSVKVENLSTFQFSMMTLLSDVTAMSYEFKFKHI